MKRRDFLCTGAAGSIAAAALLRHRLWAAPEEALKAQVFLASGEPNLAIRKLMDAMGGVSKFVKPGMTVAVKPNIAFANPPAWSTTTSPEVVQAVVQVCRGAGARRILVIDNPMQADPTENLTRSGLREAIPEDEVVQFMMIKDERKYETITPSNTAVLKTVQVARILSKVDCFINMPVAKSHRETTVSMGVKNLMGLIWDRKIFHEQLDLHRAIADLTAVIHPHLTIMDATRGLLTNGPEGPGRVGSIGKILAGTDILAVDAVTVTFAPWNRMTAKPEDVLHLKYAAELGTGIIDLNRIAQTDVT